MWNPFSKNSGADDDNKPKMNMLQRIAMKRIEKMNPKEREKLMREAFAPKNRDKMFAAMKMMKKTGQITDAQFEEAKKKLGM